jgi:hypothetical protein
VGCKYGQSEPWERERDRFLSKSVGIVWRKEVEKTRMLMAPGGPPMLTSMWCVKLHGLNDRILLLVTQAAEGTKWYSV